MSAPHTVFTAPLKVFALAAALMSVTGTATATPAETVQVHIDRHELLSPEGTERVRARLRKAADKVCGVYERQPIPMKAAARDCADRNFDFFITQVNSADFAAVRHKGRHYAILKIRSAEATG